jgi:hypothetical protein
VYNAPAFFYTCQPEKFMEVLEKLDNQTLHRKLRRLPWDLADHDETREIEIRLEQELFRAWKQKYPSGNEPYETLADRTDLVEELAQARARAESAQAGFTAAEKGIICSPDFRSVRWSGQLYEFTTQQSACMKIYYQAWKKGVPAVSDGYVLTKIEAGDKTRINKIFAEHPAWDTVIIPGETKGTHRLADPITPEKQQSTGK